MASEQSNLTAIEIGDNKPSPGSTNEGNLLRQPGGPEALEYVEVPTPVPGDGEILVKADTIGVSMPEVLVRRGTYNWMPPLPTIPGIEMSGTVVAHGA